MRNFANRKHNFHLFPLNVSINYIYTFNIVCRMFISMHDVSFRSIIAIANYNFEKYLRRVDKKYIGYRKSKRTRHIRIIAKISNSPNTGIFKKFDSKRIEMPMCIPINRIKLFKRVTSHFLFYNRHFDIIIVR